jgi:histidine triad (HIT) family protein
MIDDVFCKIINGELPSDVVYRDEEFLVIKDIKPAAPVHLLVMPISHITGLEDVSAEQEALVGRMMKIAHRVAEEQGLNQGYRLVVNEGAHGGKLVPHLHVHLLGGKPLGPKLVANEDI